MVNGVIMVNRVNRINRVTRVIRVIRVIIVIKDDQCASSTMTLFNFIDGNCNML